MRIHKGLCVVLLMAAQTTLFAQPQPEGRDRDQRRRPDDRDEQSRPRGTRKGPREAPPPAKAEAVETKPGHVWIGGRWDWREERWVWIEGHFERERANKKWRGGRWDQKGDEYAWVEGEWVDESASASATATPPTPTPPGPPTTSNDRNPPRRRDWKTDRPQVSGYWPSRGKPGTKLVINGSNFPDEAVIVWNDKSLPATELSAERITVKVPADATSGTLALRTGRGRDLPIGAFEVVAGVDPEVERRRIDDERRKRAEAEWQSRQKKIDKDKAARQAAARKQEEDQRATRDRRRTERMTALQAKWDRAFLADPDTQAELALHAQRVAELERMKAIAEEHDNSKIAVRVSVAQERENERHEQRMAALKSAFTTK